MPHAVSLAEAHLRGHRQRRRGEPSDVSLVGERERPCLRRQTRARKACGQAGFPIAANGAGDRACRDNHAEASLAARGIAICRSRTQRQPCSMHLSMSISISTSVRIYICVCAHARACECGESNQCCNFRRALVASSTLFENLVDSCTRTHSHTHTHTQTH
jgi:hypothetical protein